MIPTEIWIAIIAGVPGLVSLLIQLKKTPHENGLTDAEARKTKAEEQDIHSQVADRWAEHVNELMTDVQTLKENFTTAQAANEELREENSLLRRQILTLQKHRDVDRAEIAGLRMDIAQVRRENEEYRSENLDLKDWIERLLKQFADHMPGITPAEYIRRSRETL